MVRGVSDDYSRKMRDPVIDSLTGIAGDMRFQSKNVRNSDLGSNHDDRESDHDENGETPSEQAENPTPGLLQEDRTCMGWPGERRRHLSSETVRYAIAFFGVFMTKTENERYRGIVALTQPNSQIVYTFLSDIDVQNGLEQTADPESAAQTYSNLQKEAENFLSSIVTSLPAGAMAVVPQDWFDALHISVTALPPLAYQWLPLLPLLPLCPRLPRMGRPGAAGCGARLNPYALTGR